MSTLDEIDKIFEIFEKENCKFELMNGISQYPFENKYEFKFNKYFKKI